MLPVLIRGAAHVAACSRSGAKAQIIPGNLAPARRGTGLDRRTLASGTPSIALHTATMVPAPRRLPGCIYGVANVRGRRPAWNQVIIE